MKPKGESWSKDILFLAVYMKKEGLFHKMLNLASKKADSKLESPGIRLFNPKLDIDTLLYWQEDLFTSNFKGFVMNPFFLKEQRRRLNEAAMLPNEHGIYVLEINEGLLGGFIWCRIYDTNEYGKFGSVEEIYLIPELRGKGFGKVLMEKGEQYFISQGAKSIKLLVTITNESAVNLYKNLGYQVTRWEMQKELPKKD